MKKTVPLSSPRKAKDLGTVFDSIERREAERLPYAETHTL